MKDNYTADWQTLWYNHPASKWIEALPLGNGRLGAMITGDTYKEIISLNEDTLWTGYPGKEQINAEAIHHLDSVREKVARGEYRNAQAEVERYMLGDYDESYLPMADLEIELNQAPVAGSYHRSLSLPTGIQSINYDTQKGHICREAFISYPDQVFAYHFFTTGEEMIDMSIGLKSKLRYTIEKTGDTALLLHGEAPSYLPPHNMYPAPPIQYGVTPETKGMRFAVNVRVLLENGECMQDDTCILIRNSRDVTLLVSAATSYNGYDNHPYANGKDEVRLAENLLDHLCADFDYDVLKKRHIKDFSALYSRIYLNLGGEDHSNIPTERRIARVQGGKEDIQLSAILFQYGRYLLISSSRPGTQPANLQGIWNKDFPPYWSSGWTANINLEMNYWPAEVCGLPECSEPLLHLIRDLSKAGQRTAKELYNCSGWTAHHNIDIWRKTTPAEYQFPYISAGYSFWPMAGAWLSLHLWEHFSFTRDMEFLRDFAWPIMQQAAQFCLDWLVETPDHMLITSPSTSPENAFLTKEGKRCNISAASTMDITLIWELFTDCMEACKALDLDSDFSKRLLQAREKLYPLKAGSHGQLLEWSEEFQETEPGHRHLSPLIGLYPGKRILHEGDTYIKAAIEFLKGRTTNQKRHGWGLVWLISIYSRLGKGEQAGDCVTEMVRDSVYPNLFDLHPPLSDKETRVFQIDGNFGYTAGIAEMLLQSHDNMITLLPALPAAWSEGEVSGLRARGGYAIDMRWSRNTLESVSIKGKQTGSVTVRYKDMYASIYVAANSVTQLTLSQFNKGNKEAVQ